MCENCRSLFGGFPSPAVFLTWQYGRSVAYCLLRPLVSSHLGLLMNRTGEYVRNHPSPHHLRLPHLLTAVTLFPCLSDVCVPRPPPPPLPCFPTAKQAFRFVLLCVSLLLSNVHVSQQLNQFSLSGGCSCALSLPTKTHAFRHTANQAMCNGAEKILAGTADIVLAGGAETFSDLPIRFSRPIRYCKESSVQARESTIFFPE